MRERLTLRSMGDSYEITFSPEMVDRLQLREGDELNVIETKEGILLTPIKRELDRAMGAADEVDRR